MKHDETTKRRLFLVVSSFRRVSNLFRSIFQAEQKRLGSSPQSPAVRVAVLWGSSYDG